MEGEKIDKIIAVSADGPEFRHDTDIKQLPLLCLDENCPFFEDRIHSHAYYTGRKIKFGTPYAYSSVLQHDDGVDNLPSHNLNNLAGGPLFQQLCESSGASPPGRGRVAAYCNIGAGGRNTDVARFIGMRIPSGNGTAVYTNIGAAGISHQFSRNTDVAPRPGSILLKGILDFNVNRELARNDPTWFKNLIVISCGVIISAISMPTGNHPKSLPTEIIESFTARCSVVGFSASLVGLYLSTNKQKSFTFGCDPEIRTQQMGIVGGLATAFGFTTGVLLLLPNNLFRGITVGVACAATTIPIFMKLRPFLGAHTKVPLPGADTDVTFSGADAEIV